MEKEVATHSSILAWRIPGMEEPGGLPSMGSHRVRHDWSDLAAAATIPEHSPGTGLFIPSQPHPTPGCHLHFSSTRYKSEVPMTSSLLLLLLSHSVVSNSVPPHRRQPTRLFHPWDSPGKNTSGLPFPSPVHESEKWKWSHSVVSDS